MNSSCIHLQHQPIVMLAPRTVNGTHIRHNSTQQTIQRHSYRTAITHQPVIRSIIRAWPIGRRWLAARVNLMLKDDHKNAVNTERHLDRTLLLCGTHTERDM